MIPVFQTVVDKGKGDCSRAAIASMFELDITQVPNFILYNNKTWFNVLWYFLKSIGYTYYGCMNPDVKPTRKDLVNGCIYAGVHSRTFKDKSHAVLINSRGRVIHDPNPNQRFQNVNVFETEEIMDWYAIEKIGAGE